MTPVVKVHKRTREVVKRYRSFNEAAKDNGRDAASIRRLACNNGVSYGDFYYRLEADFDPDEDLTGKPNCPVVVKDTKTGQVAWFGCVSLAEEKLGIASKHIYTCMRRNHKVKGRFIFKYYGRRLP